MKKMRLLTLEMPAESVDAVVEYYRRMGVVEKSGAASGQVLVDDEKPGKVLVTAFWSNDHDYAEWLTSPLRDEFSAGLLAAAGGRLSATNHEFRVVHRS